jgi:rSAM/selenodomain-associated transferase 2
MNKISIIIPTLNEAENILNLLNHLINNSTKENVSEIICVDGGSRDGTQNIISNYKNIILLYSEKGRAKQMNVGAKHATGNILYFLHADSFPPKNFDAFIMDEVQKGNEAGCFRMKFNSNHFWLKLAGWLTQFNWKAFRGGDQSQFITKSLFNKIGAFNERFAIYEDNDLISKLYAQKQFVVIQKWLTTSARNYNSHGIWKLQYHYWKIHLKKWMGADANELNRYYKKNIC